MAGGILNALLGKNKTAPASDAGREGHPSTLQHVTDADFQQRVLEADKPVLVDFWAPWCGPCRIIGPVVEELARDYDGRAIVAKINTDENPATPSQYGIRGIPTLILFNGGKEMERIVGARPKQHFASMLDKIVEA